MPPKVLVFVITMTLDVFTQTYASRVRADRHAELRSHQDNREVFIHAAQAATVDLAEIDGTRLQELLKKDAIGTVFSGGDADGTDGLSNRGVTENVVGIRGFLDPPGIEFRQRPHARDRFTNVCVHPVGCRIRLARASARKKTTSLFMAICLTI